MAGTLSSRALARPSLVSLASLASLLALAGTAGCHHPKTLAAFEGHLTMHTTKAGTPPRDLVVAAKGDRLRFDMTTSSGDKTHAVYAGGAEMLFFLDASRQYMTLDFKAPAATPSTKPDTSSITRVGGHKTVAGYDCEKWSVKDMSGHHSEVCIAQGIAYFDPSRLRAGAAAAAAGQAETALARAFREKKSFPLASVDFDTAGNEVSRMEVTSIDPGSVADADFAIPDGYTKVEVPGAHH